MRKGIFSVAAFILLGAGCEQVSVPIPPINLPINLPGAEKVEVENIRAPHFVDSAPAHGDELAARPLEVVINTNFDLAPPSQISVTVGEREVAVGDTMIAPDRLSMRRKIIEDAPDGTYLVTYRACWPDKSCHDGQFAFSVDRSRQSTYEDLRGRATVEITMTDFAFAPAKVIVSPGTHIVWVNAGEDPHYINTDPHPSHNYYPAQNSSVVNTGENYELTLNEEGEYLYHCSAHVPEGMLARIIVKQ